MSWNLLRASRNVVEIMWLMVCWEQFAVVNCHRMRCVQLAWLYSCECCSELLCGAILFASFFLGWHQIYEFLLTSKAFHNPLTLYWLLLSHVINLGQCSQDHIFHHILRIPSFERSTMELISSLGMLRHVACWILVRNSLNLYTIMGYAKATFGCMQLCELIVCQLYSSVCFVVTYRPAESAICSCSLNTTTSAFLMKCRWLKC